MNESFGEKNVDFYCIRFFLFFFELGVLLGFCNSAPKMEVLTSACNPVDGKNHAPLMMPEMLFLYQFQKRFGHHKWCTIFSINRHGI